MIPLRVNDLKQWNYCPRIVFYNCLMPVAPPPTFKMEHGKSQEDLFAKLETRRVLDKYGIREGERMFRVSLASEKLGMTGKLDLLIRTPSSVFPVDFKYSRRGAFCNHLFQLAGYALLLEDRFHLTVYTGFIYSIPSRKLHRLDISAAVKKDCLDQLAEMRRMLRQQSFPEPTPRRNRCYDCEYLNFCGDVL